MSVHVRAQIRHHVKDALAAGGTLAGANVFATRAWPYDVTPALNVRSGDEVWVQGKDTSGDAIRREGVLEIEARVKDASPDDVIDELCGQVEALLGADQGLGGLAIICEYMGTRIPPPQTQDTTVMMAVLEYRVTYRTLVDVPWTALP